MDTVDTPSPSAAARRSLDTPAAVGILLVAWFAASTFVLGYPRTVGGQDAALRDRGLVLLLLLAVCAAGLLQERIGGDSA
jgi:hypothetical protein